MWYNYNDILHYWYDTYIKDKKYYKANFELIFYAVIASYILELLFYYLIVNPLMKLSQYICKLITALNYFKNKINQQVVNT